MKTVNDNSKSAACYLAELAGIVSENKQGVRLFIAVRLDLQALYIDALTNGHLSPSEKDELTSIIAYEMDNLAGEGTA